MAQQDNRKFAREFAPFLSRLIDTKPDLPTDGSIVLPLPYELRISV